MDNTMIPHRINISPELEDEINSYLFSAGKKGYDDLNLYEWISIMMWQKIYDKELVPKSVSKSIEMEKHIKAARRDFILTTGAFLIMLTAILIWGLFFK